MSTSPANASIRNIYVPIEDEPEVTEEVSMPTLGLVCYPDIVYSRVLQSVCFG